MKIIASFSTNAKFTFVLFIEWTDYMCIFILFLFHLFRSYNFRVIIFIFRIYLNNIFFIIVSATRRRNYVVLFALCPSLFAFIFYPLISLNVPRYQMVTIPAFALVSGMFAVRFNNKLMEVKKRWSSRNFLKRKGERHSI